MVYGVLGFAARSVDPSYRRLDETNVQTFEVSIASTEPLKPKFLGLELLPSGNSNTLACRPVGFCVLRLLAESTEAKWNISFA